MPVSIRFDWPVWDAVTSAAEVKQSKPAGEQRQQANDEEAKAALLSVVGDKWTRQQFILDKVPFGINRTQRILRLLASERKIERATRKPKTGTKRAVVWRRTCSGTSSDDSSGRNEPE